MPLLVNLRHLARHSVVLKDELPVSELDLGPPDEMLQVNAPLLYDIEVELLNDALLARGSLRIKLDCECVRCLKPFQHQLDLSDWACHLPLNGEDAVAIHNDCVDLTPQLREDILLAFPAHPVCNTACDGLAGKNPGSKKVKPSGDLKSKPLAWNDLDKLKF